MILKNFFCWYQISQTNLERKIYVKIIQFHKIWEKWKISVFKVIV